MRYLILLFLFFGALNYTQATGWLPGENEGYLKLNQSMIRSQQFYDQTGVLTETRTLANYTSSLYFEYGFSDNFATVGYIPFFVRNTLNRTEGESSGRVLEPGAANNNIGDPNVGLKYRFHKDEQWVLSTGVLLGIPLGDVDDENGLITGDGEFNQHVFIEFGRSFDGPFYLAGRAGFNHRTKGFSDEFRYLLEGGYQWTDWFQSIIKIQGRESFFNGDSGSSGGMMGLFANNAEVLSVGPEFVFNVSEDFSVISSAFTPLKGKNIFGAPSWNLGVSYTF